MKLKKPLKITLYVLGGLFILGIINAAIDDFKKTRGIKEGPDGLPLVAGAGLEGTTWYSNRVAYDWKAGSPNIVVLSFYDDSMHFELPNGDIVEMGLLLNSHRMASAMEKKYTWDYEADKKSIKLDPGITGYGIQLERSGDSLIWKSKLPPGLEHLTFRRTQDIAEYKP